MIVVKTSAGIEIQGETALDVLRELNARALISEPDAWRYMLRVAERARRATGRLVRVSDPESFLRDMATAGLLEVTGFDNPQARTPRR